MPLAELCEQIPAQRSWHHCPDDQQVRLRQQERATGIVQMTAWVQVDRPAYIMGDPHHAALERAADERQGLRTRDRVRRDNVVQ